jgi:hypothetical protein
MMLPNAEKAVVAEAKVIDYLLNPAHLDGATKARFFVALGFSRDEWEVLAGRLRHLAETAVIASTVESVHGIKYIIEGPITGPRGRIANVRTVWIVDAGATAPRFVTAYPHDAGAES